MRGQAYDPIWGLQIASGDMFKDDDTSPGRRVLAS
jgi:hypothetical protein